MPPSGIPPQSNEGQINTGSAEPYYSNEDVAILHDIVALAQELLPTLPERERLPTNALFTAYYDILPRLGLDADHDNRYARVLFKIGGLRTEATLYERFEEILSRMGIEIEFGNDDDEEQSTQPGVYQPELGIPVAETMPQQDDHVETKKHHRRNSESSFWDQTNDLPPMPPPRRNSFSTIAQLAPQPDERPGFLQDIQPSWPTLSNSPHRQDPIGRPQDHIGAWLNSRQEKPMKRRGRSVSTHSSLRIRRRAPSIEKGRHGRLVNPSIPGSDHYHAASEDTAVTSTLNDDTNSTESFPNQFYQELNISMEHKAVILLRERSSFLVRRQLPLWREKALQLREHHATLDSIAVRHDRTVLLSISLATWQKLWLEHRMVRDRKKHYVHLEHRAIKARDLYLKIKILQQWSFAAQRQITRTTHAQQHILKLRYFNAWAEITAMNEFKVRRQILSKFLSAWRRRCGSVSAGDTYAVQRYEENLVEKIYWQWVRRQWDVKAPAWWAEGLKRHTLFSLIAQYHISWENQQTAERARKYRLARQAWRIWRDRTLDQVRRSDQATDLFRIQTCRKALVKWSREAQIGPIRIIIQTRVERRMLRDAFDIWLYRTRQERQAAEVDRMKILQEAVTTWRHQYRSALLRAKTNMRLKAEALFDMLEAEKAALIERMRKEKWLRGIMRTWIERARVLKEKRLHMEATAQSHLAQKSQEFRMDQWFEKAQAHKDRTDFATAFYQQRLVQRTIAQWSERAQKYQKLEKWSCDAEFYFQTTKTIKQWKASTESAKRAKRKVAYAYIRRTVKINLATGTLRNWRQQAQHILDLQRQAQGVCQNKDVVLGIEVFDRWRARSADIVELEPIWHVQVLRKYMSVWVMRSSSYQALDREAVLFFEEKREGKAFKRWNLIMLQLRAQRNYAYDIREKNAKRTFRKMLGYWRQKAALKRPPKFSDSEEPPDELGAMEGNESLSEHGGGAENNAWASGSNEAVPSTPIPGYLSTPSKRSERMMAVAERFSTTPRAHMSTPFERQLRAQYSGGQLYSFQKRTGKSTLGTGSGFDDIEVKRHE